MPVTTYRLQLHRGFALTNARDVCSYLSALGVTDCYCSPVFSATPGSTHGYDVCSHNEINPELGGEGEFAVFAGELRRLGMGLILDFVPNHMSNDASTNEWWRDVLENGPSSPFARFFDIDWDPVKPELKDRLLLPILGEQYGEALESGALVLRFERGALVLVYGANVIPINPRRSPLVFEHNLEMLERTLGDDHGQLREFLSILTSLRNLPPYTERDLQRIAERRREKEVARERLARLVEASPTIREHLEAAVAAFNGAPGDPASFDRLHMLLELQPYRLASWRTAADEINYRRFFDVNHLAGLRVEERRVFNEIHRLALRLIETRQITGLRLDHIDGLFDPAAYLEQLQAAARDTFATSAVPPSPAGNGGIEGSGDGSGLYVVVEKILSASETLRDSWPVAGTTGYNFLNQLNGVFVEAAHARKLERIYGWFTGRRTPFSDVAYESRRLMVTTALSSEFQVLAQAVNRLSERDRRSRDFTLGSIHRALREVVSCFPVYRTYVSEAGATETDHAVVDAAIADARHRNPAMESSIFGFLRSVLLPDRGSESDQSPAVADAQRRLDVAMRFQQCTAPVQAKGIEDTAFYRYHVLASLNEVGGDPGRFGRTTDEFHAANLERQKRWPMEMLATTTHDTKRSEDARARINVLSEIPEEWQHIIARWTRLNAQNRTRLADGPAPAANDAYLFYQALVGAWPAEALDAGPVAQMPSDFVERLVTYMNKAIKEAKTHTSWITENREYELGVSRFVEQTLAGPRAAAFFASFVPFIRRIASHGMINSLAQLVLKIASPGVADFYQGTELWDLSLVDPDNRRPVDYGHRHRLLQELEPWLALTTIDAAPADDDAALADAVARLLEKWPDGRIKLFVTACGIRLRRARRALFLRGDYLPLSTEGPRGRHLIACARRFGTDVLVTVAPRLTTHLVGGMRLPLGRETWADTYLNLPDEWAHRRFRHLLTGERVVASKQAAGGALPVWRALRTCPVALLWAEPS
jgi:(1->4)-alpha-D-glucan 1-alpha-D-glucosylmutase